jgi:anaerobic magnesium-protoporphyrin IX monomethyl ester cyclase
MSKNRKVLLVQLRCLSFPPATPYAGVGYLAEMLLNNGIECSVLDMLLGYSLEDLVQRIRYLRPDILAVSMMTLNYKRNYELLNYVKEQFPDITIIVGGPHASAFKEKVLEECKGIDLVALYEGEEILLELAKGQNVAAVLGLIFKKGEEIIANPARKYNEDLDSFPYPTYRLFEMSKYNQHEIHLITSRGCPYSCTFCTVNTSMGKRVRVRTPKNVVDEIEYWVKKGYKIFGIGDDNFTFYKERVYEICDEIKRRNLGRLEFRCHNGIRTDRTDRDLLRRMKEVGVDFIQISVESASQRMLDNMRKGVKVERIAGAVEDALAVGMEVQLAFVIGTQNETWQDLEASFNFARKYPVWRADHNHLYPYPGTELFEWAKANKAFIKPPEEYLNDENPDYKSVPVMETPQLSKEQRILAGKIFQQISRDLYRKAAYRKLERFGLMGRIAAWAFTSNVGQYLFYRNKLFRRIVDTLRLVVIK